MNKNIFTHFAIFALSIFVLNGCGGQPPKTLAEPLKSAANFERHGIEAYQSGNYLASIKYFKSALIRYRSVDKRKEQARTHINLAQSALIINELMLANQQMEQLDTLIQQTPLKNYLPRWLLLKTDYLIRQQQYPEAIMLLEDLISKHSLGNKRIKQAALTNRAIVAVRTNSDKAETYIKRAQRSFAVNDQTRGNARLLRLEAQLMQRQQNHELAEKLYKQALEMYRKDLFQPGIAATLADLGTLMIDIENISTAQTLLKRALAIRLTLGDRYTGKHLLNQLFELAMDRNDESAAIIYEKQLENLRNQSAP